MATVNQTIPQWKTDRLQQISKDTLNEVKEKLNKNNRVLVERPTGFGKSYMLAGLTSDNIKSLYVYPTTVIKQDVIGTYGPNGKDERASMLKNTTFISYKKLTNIINSLEKSCKATIGLKEVCSGIYEVASSGADTKVVIENYQGEKGLRNWFRQFGLIMLDEAHKACSTGFLKTWDKISSIITSSEKTKLIGVTATPDRLDGRNIREIFGKQNGISKLTLSDCIREGLLSKFDYVYTIGDRKEYLSSIVEEINNRRLRAGNSKLQQYEITELINEIARVPSVTDTLRNSITKEHTGGNSYMKFVVFFKDKKHIEQKGDIVKDWFTQAFPNMNVEAFNIVTKGNASSVNYEIQDIDILDSLVPSENRIDLIFCVDKLNMGYHVESITGIVLLRETLSAVIYNQQIGRCFSVRSMNKPIIIDIIDKCEAGSTLDKVNNTNNNTVAKGVKLDLPTIIENDCVDVINYTVNIIRLAMLMIKQSYEMYDTVIFLRFNRHAPLEVIQDMTKLSDKEIKSIISKYKKRGVKQ